VLGGIIHRSQFIDGETHPAWCDRHDGLLAFSPAQIIASAVVDTSGPDWHDSGVYFLVWDDQLAYVGRSRHIVKRLHEHRAEGRPFQKVAAITGLSDAGMQEVEDAYCRVFSPPWNAMATNGYLFTIGLQKQLQELSADGVMPWFSPRLSGPASIGLKPWQLHVIGRRQQGLGLPATPDA
jgi:hypothetical protein